MNDRTSKELLLASIFLICSLGIFHSVSAYEPPCENCTMMGATLSGNEDGTIPAYSGGITKPPQGYKIGDHHPDPFKSDKILFTISSKNIDEHKQYLTDGQIALLQKYPNFHLNIYPTHRSASFPEKIYAALASNAKNSRIVDNGNSVTGAKLTSPFPVPKTGQEVIWNHLLRYRGEKITRISGQVNPTANGSYTMIRFHESMFFNYGSENYNESDNNFLFYYQHITEPTRLAGEMLLVHETLNQVREPRHSWTYNPGQRRVRRAPNISYDNPGTASDGLRTNDQLDMFNGAIDRYDWKLIDKKEIYVPYNSYKLHSDKVIYDELIKAGHLNPDFLRYERHRVWVLEATLKSGTNHIYSKRVMYLDEDSWQILHVDHYDSRGNLWRVAEAHCINYYEVPVFWGALEISYDLQSGRYTANGFDNDVPMYNFNATLSPSDFKPNELRNQGRR